MGNDGECDWGPSVGGKFCLFPLYQELIAEEVVK